MIAAFAIVVIQSSLSGELSAAAVAGTAYVAFFESAPVLEGEEWDMPPAVVAHSEGLDFVATRR